MPLPAQATLLLSFDVAPEMLAEHDDWHTHEHLPERLSIPGFLRGSRWTAVGGGPRYFVMYEVESLATLTSEAYLARLNAPSAWTQKMMPGYRDMNRGLCSVTASFGAGIGGAALLVRFKPVAGKEDSLRRWLREEALPPLASLRGVGGAHLFEGAVAAPMTNEQRIRGVDAGFDWAVLATGYDEEALAALTEGVLSTAQLEAHGAGGVQAASYRLGYALTDREARTSSGPAAV
ncbi:MAG: hypothetical protein AB7O31_18600 [Burkholderiales bacterium]